jgi:hypothetical protein
MHQWQSSEQMDQAGLRRYISGSSEDDEMVDFLLTGKPASMIQDMTRNFAACSGLSHAS